jgi:hypothetical protein
MERGDVMPGWVKQDLTKMPLAELCAKLRGEYGDSVHYEAHPLSIEAARRLNLAAATLADIRSGAKGGGVE